MRACLAASAFIEGPSVLVSSAAQSREPRWSPSGVVASGTRGNTLGGPSVWPTSPHVSRRIASSRGWAWPTSVGIDVPQCTQRVRRARLPSARRALPLIAIDEPLALFVVQEHHTDTSATGTAVHYQRLRPSLTTAQPRGAFARAPPSLRGRARLTLMLRPFRSVPSSP